MHERLPGSTKVYRPLVTQVRNHYHGIKYNPEYGERHVREATIAPMPDQSFSVDNFRAMFDYENRKGIYLEGKFFPAIAELTEEIKTKVANIRKYRKLRRDLPADLFNEQHSKLSDEITQLRTQKEALLARELDQISKEISAPSFRVSVSQVELAGGKTAFTIDSKPSSYFAIKQLQENIRSAHRVKQKSRYQIVRQLIGVLGDFLPKYVIRTDFEDFYESIDTTKLLKSIYSAALLTAPSTRILEQVLADYQALSGRRNGLPRGIGISAYLAEIYMREFDSSVRAHGEVIFYARYVDDIVIVFAPGPNTDVNSLLPFVEHNATGIGLRLNLAKTECLDMSEPARCELDYLGYRIGFRMGDAQVRLGKKRMEKYKRRIALSFEAYRHKSKHDEKRARRLLLKRMRFLTGNTRLTNNKAHVLVGSYFSNSLISSTADLHALDGVLESHIQSISPGRLKSRLSDLSFVDGFTQRKYYRFSANELSQIASIWKHAI